MYPFKNKKQSPEHIRKRVLSRMKNGKYEVSEAVKERLRTCNIGRKQSSETIKKRVESRKNYFAEHPEYLKRFSKLMKEKYKNGYAPVLGKHWKKTEEQIMNRVGERNPEWRGEKAGYVAKHRWMKKWYGNPPDCEGCGIKGKRLLRKDGNTFWSIHWANISGKYLRERSDYTGLCWPCHQEYDRTNGLWGNSVVVYKQNKVALTYG